MYLQGENDWLLQVLWLLYLYNKESNITVLLDVMNQLASNADLDYGLYKVEWLCSLVLRLGETFEEALLPNLRQAHDLISLMIRHNEESSDVHDDSNWQ